MKKIPSWVITFAALILSIILAANFIKANKDTADQLKNSDSDEKVIIIAKSNFKEIQAALKEYPEDLDEKKALDSGFIVIEDEKIKGDGVELWKKFCEKIKKKKDGAILTCQFTVEGDAIITYISYKDGTYYFVEDTTRDELGSQGYENHTYSSMKRFEEDHRYLAVLTTKDELSYQDVKNADHRKEIVEILNVDLDTLK